jgi:hypothetical protein
MKFCMELDNKHTYRFCTEIDHKHTYRFCMEIDHKHTYRFCMEIDHKHTYRFCMEIDHKHTYRFCMNHLVYIKHFKLYRQRETCRSYLSNLTQPGICTCENCAQKYINKLCTSSAVVQLLLYWPCRLKERRLLSYSQNFLTLWWWHSNPAWSMDDSSRWINTNRPAPVSRRDGSVCSLSRDETPYCHWIICEWTDRQGQD